jgi:hypothetical protein
VRSGGRAAVSGGTCLVEDGVAPLSIAQVLRGALETCRMVHVDSGVRQGMARLAAHIIGDEFENLDEGTTTEILKTLRHVLNEPAAFAPLAHALWRAGGPTVAPAFVRLGNEAYQRGFDRSLLHVLIILTYEGSEPPPEEWPVKVFSSTAIRRSVSAVHLVSAWVRCHGGHAAWLSSFLDRNAEVVPLLEPTLSERSMSTHRRRPRGAS